MEEASRFGRSASPLPATQGIRELRPPPGPRLPLAVQTVLFGAYRHHWVPKLRGRYGDVFVLRVYPKRRLVYLANPEHIRTVFGGPSARFHAGEGNMFLKPIMGERSVLMTDEDEHRRIRRLLMPPFHGAALRGYQDMIAGVAAAELERWPCDTVFSAHERMRALTMEVILRVVFGVGEGTRLDELRRLLEQVVSLGLLVLISGHMEWARRFGAWKRPRELLRQVDTLLYAEIAERRLVDDLEGRTDVLSRLLAVELDGDRLSDLELRDQLITLLLAGHETTATALAWAFHELSRDPVLLAAAIRAADNGDERYLEAVVKESMRLHPVVYEVARKLTEDVEIGGYRILVGSTIVPAIGLVHADPDNHDDPEAFRPQRFLDGDATSSTWLPFGGGVRRCLGAGFSLLEAGVVLYEVLTRYRIAPDRHRREPARPRNITFAPARGARISVRRR